MSHIAFQPQLGAPRLTREAALQYFVNGAKATQDFGIGVESEMFLVRDADLSMCSYAQVTEFLQALATAYGWTLESEHDNILGLSRDGVLIALEPGGQIEYASTQFSTIQALQHTYDRFQDELRTIAQPRGYNLLSFGLHPTEQINAIPMIPKARYAVMAPRLEEMGPLARAMMRGTCAWQCALDYSSEADFRQKFAAVYHVTSIMSALYANAAWEHGEPSGSASRRLQIWTQTDPVRCGLIRDVYHGNFGFEAYYEYAAAIPMLFIVRNDAWVNVRGLTFAEFLRDGYQGHTATQEDWFLHLSTLFPEARLKHYIEIRGADASRLDWFYSFPALFTGIFAESSLMDAACDLTRRLSYAARMELHHTIAKEGLATRLGRIPVYELARELVAIAMEGLRRRGHEEDHYLQPVADFLRTFHATTLPLIPASLERADLRPYLLM